MSISEPMSSSQANYVTASDGLPTSTISTGTSSGSILELQVLMTRTVKWCNVFQQYSFILLLLGQAPLTIAEATVPPLLLVELHQLYPLQEGREEVMQILLYRLPNPHFLPAVPLAVQLHQLCPPQEGLLDMFPMCDYIDK